MRIHPMSDTHFERLSDHGKNFIDSLDPTGVDVLALAGDIGCKVNKLVDGLEPSLRMLCAKYPEVVYVTGNHEFYFHGRASLAKALRKVAKDCPNFHPLDNGVWEHKGVRFLGTTLWFPDDPNAAALRAS